MTAFLLWPLAALELTPRALTHLYRLACPAPKETPDARDPYRR